jgi:hypothetical protein
MYLERQVHALIIVLMKNPSIFGIIKHATKTNSLAPMKLYGITQRSS